MRANETVTFPLLFALLLGPWSCADSRSPQTEPGQPSAQATSSTATDSAPPQPAPSQVSPATQPAPADTAWTVGIVEKGTDAGGSSTLTDVRAAGHPEYDRIAFEWSGEGLPGYAAEYVDRPVRECGSGRVVELRGDATLRLRFQPARAHSEEGETTIDPRSFDPELTNLLQVVLICDFEGSVEYALAVRSPNRYRVLELREPARVVVDVER